MTLVLHVAVCSTECTVVLWPLGCFVWNCVTTFCHACVKIANYWQL